MNLREFLHFYNFREITENDKENTSIIRVYPDEWEMSDYFEVGVYDFGDGNILESVIVDKILDRPVSSFRVNDNGYISVYLNNDKERMTDSDNVELAPEPDIIHKFKKGQLVKYVGGNDLLKLDPIYIILDELPNNMYLVCHEESTAPKDCIHYKIHESELTEIEDAINE